MYIDAERCDGCGICAEICPQRAIYLVEGVAQIDHQLCTGCESCLSACPQGAIQIRAPEREIAVTPQKREPLAIPSHRPSPLVPLVGAALSFIGREILPKLATSLTDVLQRPQSPSTKAGNLTAQPGAGRQRRRRRRGR